MARLKKNSDSDFFIFLSKKEDFRLQYPLTRDLHLHSYLDSKTGEKQMKITFLVDGEKLHSDVIPPHSSVKDVEKMINNMYQEIKRRIDSRLF